MIGYTAKARRIQPGMVLLSPETAADLAASGALGRGGDSTSVVLHPAEVDAQTVLSVRPHDIEGAEPTQTGDPAVIASCALIQMRSRTDGSIYTRAYWFGADLVVRLFPEDV